MTRPACAIVTVTPRGRRYDGGVHLRPSAPRARVPSRRAVALAAVLAAGPGPAPAAPTQEDAPPRAMRPWWDRAEERRIGHYWIKTDAEPQSANALAEHLNLLYDEFARRLAALPQRGPERLNVLIFHRQRDYLMELRTRFGVDGEGTGGMFFVKPAGTALAIWTQGLTRRRIEHVLQHEGFHQFAYSRFGADLPIWVNEGLAEFFGNAVRVRGGFVIGQASPRSVDRVRDALERGVAVPFSRMLAMSPAQWQEQVAKGQGAMLYDQAWSMVQFLVYADGGRHVPAFERYLHLINGGVLSDRAFPQAFGPDVDAFEKRWMTLAAEARPTPFLAAMERIEFLAEGALELSRRHVVPATLAELRRRLEEIGFGHTVEDHGWSLTTRADDPSAYDIPSEGGDRPAPRFVVEPVDPADLSLRERMLQERWPRPPHIATSGLTPRDLKVEWRRDERSAALSYEIIVD